MYILAALFWMCLASSLFGSSGDRNRSWCTIAYWELRQRVGKPYFVLTEDVNIVQYLPHGDGMCLSQLQPATTDARLLRSREKIGIGLTLSREPATGVVWLYNRSGHPVFVNSLKPPSTSSSSPSASSTRDHLDLRTAKFATEIYKLQPGFCVQIFDYRWRVDTLLRESQLADRSSGLSREDAFPRYDGPANPYSVQVSFAKGWGSRYKRQSVTLCPCWIELLLDATANR